MQFDPGSSSLPFDASVVPPNAWLQTLQPLGAYILQGLTCWRETLVSIDAVRGYLLQIDPQRQDTRVLNPYHTQDFLDVTGLSVWEDTLWLAYGPQIYACANARQQLATPSPLELRSVATLPYPVDDITVQNSTVYVSCKKAGCIFILEAQSGRQITKFYAPGVGLEGLTVRGEELWVCDRTEQTVYCLDRATGEVLFSVLTPFESPTGLAFCPSGTGEQPTQLYVAYAFEEPYIRDNPNADPSHELAQRDRTFIHPLYVQHYPQAHYALSNGYRLEMSYVEELFPLEDVSLENLEWRIALPADTDRQKVRQVEAVGLPFTEEVQAGQRVAVFKFDALQPGERHIFGWKAILDVWSIKYQISPEAVKAAPDLTPEWQERYLVDDDELSMSTAVIRQAAQEAIGTETNLLRKMLKIRNYVYDHLSYGIKPHIDPPDVVLQRGVGSCGEYVGLILALARLNGIACRTVGRYKCPPHPDRPFVPLEPDFNHVWIEFYIPGFGWVPMESNPDDVVERGPYPTRFFMGLSWYHAEMGKGISFETLRSQGMPVQKEQASLGDLAINHVRFRILAELAPPPEIGKVD